MIKLIHIAPVVEASAKLGLPDHLAGGLAVLLLACLALYVVPRTAALGAVLLTGYLGGAVAIHLRIGDPLLSHTLFPVHVGAMLRAGLLLRDPRVRAVVDQALIEESGPRVDRGRPHRLAFEPALERYHFPPSARADSRSCKRSQAGPEPLANVHTPSAPSFLLAIAGLFAETFP